ncbi:class I SAM-dependent methyltransferase [Pseudonocardia kujensis]|uniref:class I SAM-dependent methyltransferase n=1 Tax=Pseudonocardia kujensis TaxID=1128675 RepID=UPI001E45CA71|nr:class I SAM-dependent methyltransferase [Pseudonocardia kujensis]MCE0767101.1 class I SAM-dependent methyltransferase [Pseudonocardia kujensis]
MTSAVTTAATAVTTESLTDRLFGAVLATMDLHAVSVGDRLGYYRALADGAPLTPAELAGRTGTAERYTREWCEQQAVTGILTADAESDGTARRYALPGEHRAALVEVLSLDHVVPLARFVMGCITQSDLLAEAFRTGGGVSWGQHGADVREAQAAANRPMFLGPLAREYLPSVPDVDAALRAGARVADVGCGHGWSAVGIALAYPEVTVDGFDLDMPSIEAARRNAREAGVADRVRFHPADAGTAEGTYDVVFAFECIHDLPDPVAVLRAMHGLGGTVVVMDERVAETFAAPGGEIERLMYGYSLLCCLADGLAHEHSAGTGTVMRPDTLRGYAREAGFADLEILGIEDDFFRFYRLVR